MAAPPHKRLGSFSLVLQVPDLNDEEPAKKAKTSPLQNEEIRAKADEVYRQALKIFSEVKSVPLTYWQSLEGYLEKRLANSKNIYQIIVKDRKPDYAFQAVEIEPTQKFTPTPPDLDPPSQKAVSPPKKKVKGLLESLKELEIFLKRYSTHLRDSEEWKKIREMEFHETNLISKYQKKIPALRGLVSLKFPATDPLLAPEVPQHAFPLVSDIRAQLEEVPALKSIETLLDLAQKIHNHYKQTCLALPSFLEKFHFCTLARNEYLRQLTAAKNLRRYADTDEKRVHKHLNRSQLMCEEQQKSTYLGTNPAWADAKVDEAPPVPCQAEPLLGMSYVLHAVKGTRRKKEIEDKAEAALLHCLIDGDQIDLPLFAIMDGHGGAENSKFCKEHLAAYFKESLQKYNSTGFSLSGILNAGKETCCKLHEDSENISGTTLIFATIIDNLLFVFFVGDSRAILIKDEPIPLPLSCDASPKEPYFSERVKLKGGTIIGGRVDGNLRLNMTSSTGDKLDAQFLTQTPLARAVSLPGETQKPVYLALYSDGISDVASDEDICTHIRELEAQDVPLENIAATLLQKAHKANHATLGDDVSLILVKLKIPIAEPQAATE